MEPLSCEGIYIGHLQFHTGSVVLVLNSATGCVSPQFYVVFDDKFSTVSFIWEGTIPPNCTDLVQRSSYIVAPDNNDLKDIWFTQYIEEDPIKPPSHESSIAPDNNNETLTSMQSELHVQ